MLFKENRLEKHNYSHRYKNDSHSFLTDYTTCRVWREVEDYHTKISFSTSSGNSVASFTDTTLPDCGICMLFYTHLDTGVYGKTTSAMVIDQLILKVQFYNGLTLKCIMSRKVVVSV